MSYALCNCDTNRYICSSVDFWPFFFVSEWAGQSRSENRQEQGRALSKSNMKVGSLLRAVVYSGLSLETLYPYIKQKLGPT